MKHDGAVKTHHPSVLVVGRDFRPQLASGDNRFRSRSDRRSEYRVSNSSCYEHEMCGVLASVMELSAKAVRN